MKKISKITTTALTITSALSFAAPEVLAAGSNPVTADPAAEVDYSGTLSILTKFGSQQLSPFFEDVAKQYTEMHPEVSVELIQETDDSVKGKTKTLVATNSMPDIFFSWTGTWGGNFIRGNRAVDLTPVVGAGTEWGKTFTPAALDAFSYGGRNFGVPLYLDAKFMGYNKSLFADLGLEPPTTFDALLETCDTISAAGVVPVSFGNKEAWPAVHYAGQLLVYNVPVETLEQDFDPQTSAFDHPGYVTALDQFRAFIEHCTTGAPNGTSYEAAVQAFSDEKAAMYYQEIIEFDGSANSDTALQPEEFGYFVLPAPEDAQGDPNAIEGAPEGYMVSAASDQIPLAIDFLKFLTTQETGKVLSASPYGQPSAVVGGSEPRTMNASVVAGMADIDEASYLMPWLDTVHHPRVAATWLSGLQALVGGSMSSEELVAEVRETSAAVRD
ncbi:extracellular solute-binding protein [Alloyangia pacifica]|uniref:Carbohydrate ABC transporter substrate-binding protein, CUT1 family n=1 Tax=Alloyangia pacifica TaxID=311180 RepID=A0A1I6W5R3_9RHOB|nr:extracellular solute-binding protein [Alloyangia pacifica]SDI67717.1 carbohydrate ABC transporter substrate-binding protein, CUT1 family [Alloyangia pacifica]SFT21323.1 carbohydrate ABC transporter substrate-binding protein, CUT1 family [Alloyangia pacifica]